MSHDILNRIHELVCDQLGVDRSDLTAEANLLEDLGADSLDVVELVMALEETFGLSIDDDQVETLRTIGDVESYIVSCVAA